MIDIEHNNDENYKKYILDSLVESNKNKCEWFRNNPLTGEDSHENFLVFDDGKVVGGAVGYILYSWYFLDLLWVDEAYRGKNIGTSLIKKVEDYVRAEKLTGVRIETWDFQAKGFYEKMGYKEFARIEDCPPGTVNYFFMKKFI